MEVIPRHYMVKLLDKIRKAVDESGKVELTLEAVPVSEGKFLVNAFNIVAGDITQAIWIKDGIPAHEGSDPNFLAISETIASIMASTGLTLINIMHSLHHTGAPCTMPRDSYSLSSKHSITAKGQDYSYIVSRKTPAPC